MAPDRNERVDAEVARLIYAEVTRRFDEEDHWRVELESKAGTFLGFLGVFLGILLVYGASSRAGAVVPLESIAVPTALQVASALLLLGTLYGRGQYVGPSPADVVNSGRLEVGALAMELAGAYAVSLLANRVRHKRALAGYHLALLLSAAGLVEVACSTVADIASPGAGAGKWPLAAPYWMPGLLVVLLMTAPLRRGYANEGRGTDQITNRSKLEREARVNETEGRER